MVLMVVVFPVPGPLSLMHAMLKAVAAGTRLILVGDVNQLPSVGAGSVLKDMIDSGQFHIVRLTRIFRQAAAALCA